MIPHVSVVVPTHRRPELLRRCLEALLVQDFAPGHYEIIVADDAASDETRALIHRVLVEASQKAYIWAAESAGAGVAVALTGQNNYYDHGTLVVHTAETLSPSAACTGVLPCVRWVPVTGGSHGPAAARNAGWRAALGDLIAFTDDDCIPAPGWLRAGVEAFGPVGSDAPIIGVSGQTVMPLPLAPTDYELNAAALQRSEFVTANCFYRRDALEAVGGFDERFTTAWREDSDLFFTFLEACGPDESSKRLIRAPGAIVFHPIRPASWGISLPQQRKNRFNALLYKKHPHLYRQRIQPAPPWHYYGIVAALLAVLLGLAVGRIGLSLAGAALWTYLTGRFLRRRLSGASRKPAHIAEMVVTSMLIPPVALFWRITGAIEHRVFFL